MESLPILLSPEPTTESKEEISTEPSFASQTDSNFPAGRARLVLSTDVFWSFASKKGILSMVLDNRSRMKLDMNDPGRLAAWSLTASTHDVLFDGTTLSSRVDTGIP